MEGLLEWGIHIPSRRFNVMTIPSSSQSSVPFPALYLFSFVHCPVTHSFGTRVKRRLERILALFFGPQTCAPGVVCSVDVDYYPHDSTPDSSPPTQSPLDSCTRTTSIAIVLCPRNAIGCRLMCVHQRLSSP
jgi:hypothetical protein